MDSQADVAKEGSASPPSCDSMSHPMDIGNSDAESPEPAAGPVNPLWSPQYSPTKLAELVPVNHSPEPSLPPNNGSNAMEFDHLAHSERSAETQGLAPSDVGHMHRSHGFIHSDTPHQHQHQLLGSRLPKGHAGSPSYPEPNRFGRGHVASASGMLDAVAVQARSPFRPGSMQHSAQVTSNSITINPSMPHHTRIPTSSQRQVNQSASMAHNHWRQTGWQPHEQHTVSDRQGQPLRAELMHSAPASFLDQSEQQLHHLTHSPTSRETLGLDNHPSSQPGISFQPVRQQHNMPSPDQCYNPEEPQIHGDTYAGHDRQAFIHRKSQLRHPGDQVRQDSHASSATQLPAGQHMLNGQHSHAVPAGPLPAQLPNVHSHDRQDQMPPFPSASPLSGLAMQSAGHADHQVHLSHPLLPQAQAATVLSPELSAALAAGMLGDSVTSSALRLPVQDQQQPALSHQPQPQHHQVPGGSSASALPAELSAALASGQLNLQLVGFNHATFSQHTAHQGRAGFQPTQAAYQSEPAAFQPGQPAGQAALQTRQAVFLPEQPVLQSEAGRWTRQPPQANAGLDHGQQPPSRLSFHPNPVASAHNGSHAGPRRPSHAGVSGSQAAMQMTMSSPSLQTQPHLLVAAAQHGAAAGRQLPVSASGLQQGTGPHLRPQHEPQHVRHGSQPARLAPQHSQQEQQSCQFAFPLPYHESQPTPLESNVQFSQMPLQHPKHEPQRPAEHAEHWDRPQVSQPEYPSEQQWQARAPHHG